MGYRSRPTQDSARFRSTKKFVERFAEEVLAPHHALVDAESKSFMVAPVAQDAFPPRRFGRDEFRREQRVENPSGVMAVAVGEGNIVDQFGELKHTARRDGGRGALRCSNGIRLFPIVRWH